MRNLWNIIVRYQVLLVFILLEGLALTWFSNSHGYPRGRWVRASLALNSQWDSHVSDLARISDLATQNEELLMENARLRSELLSQMESVSASQTQTWNNATGKSETSQVIGAKVIRSMRWNNGNRMVINRGEQDGVHVGQGVVEGSMAIGRVIETNARHALVLPLVHKSLEWSARVGQSGPAGRLLWDGRSINRGTLVDIPRSFDVSTGDTLYTTGFQGFFPTGFLIGIVADKEMEPAGEFQILGVHLPASFQSLQYVHVIDTGSREVIDSLTQKSPGEHHD